MLGVLGGGQLGRYFVMAAHELGYQVMVLDPDRHSPAGRIADAHLLADYDDRHALEWIAAACSAVTTEFEKVPADSLAYLARSLPVRPDAEAVRICQDRSAEKGFLKAHGFPHAPYADIRGEDDIEKVQDSLFPGILKVARGGYDGKGQAGVRGRSEALAAYRQLGDEPCVLERRMALDGEVSVVLARDETGRIGCFPASENRHRQGILDISIAPAPGNLGAEAGEIAEGIAERMGYVGTLCVEFFVVAGRLYVNEIAPRAHNSGHYSLDTCVNQSIRAAGASPLRPTAGRYLRPLHRFDGQSSGRPLVSRRHRWPGKRARLGQAACAPQPQTASLWQATGAAGPQDGPFHPARHGSGHLERDRHGGPCRPGYPR
jgi:5-(carboxyamino)imidazole ribonucleotide synthase